jgi:hypothetical protein
VQYARCYLQSNSRCSYCPLSYCSPSRLSNGNCGMLPLYCNSTLSTAHPSPPPDLIPFSDIICNISLCQYDGGECLCPANQCPPSLRGNGVCNRGCASAGCKYDNGDCCNVELCTLRMRNNSHCDPPCNNKACAYDGGECPVTNTLAAENVFSSSTTAHDVESSKFNAKFRPVSVLQSPDDSPVLRAIHLHASKLIADHLIAEHEARASSANQHKQHTRTPLSSSSASPSAVMCSGSTFSMASSFIDSGSEALTVQSSGCSGIASCSSCGVCGVCRATGCDTSFFDGFCQSKGPTWACSAIQPSLSNNFSSFGCINTAVPPTPTPTPIPPPAVGSGSFGSESTAISPGAIAGIAVAAVAVAVLLVVAALFVYRHHRRGSSRSTNEVVEVQMQSIASASQGLDRGEPDSGGRGRDDGGGQGLL